MSRILAYILGSALLLALSGCREKVVLDTVAETTVPAIVETTAAAVVETVPAVTEPVLLERDVDGKVCVGFIPTEAGGWRYVVLEDQEAAVAAFEKANAAMVEGEPYKKGDRTQGLMVVYGDFWDILESGDMAAGLGRVSAEDASELYEMCVTAAAEAGRKESVKPEQIVDLTSAVLEVDGQEHSLTDPEKLESLAQILSGAQYYLGTTKCPFGYLLTMETAAGETLTVSIAADSCGTWMSEGDYYDFGNDNALVLELFGVTME